MPRSNKKKSSQNTPFRNSPGRPPPQPPPENPSSSTEIDILLDKERTVMMSRAISSAQKHGINVKPGRPNPGAGDCPMTELAFNKSSSIQLIGTGEFSSQIWQTEPCTLLTIHYHLMSGSRGGVRCYSQEHMKGEFLEI